MADLKCKVDTCGYNKSECCCKGDIMVGGKSACCTDDTCCESFNKEKKDSFTNSLSPEKTISIDCDAVNCTHNTDYKCYADHVDIKGCGACDCQQTACATFKEK